MTQIAEAVEGSTPHLFTFEEYMALDIPGRTELIEGVIYDVSAKYEPHSLAIRRLNQALTAAIGKPGDQYEISVQDPIAVNGWNGPNGPEVDVAVILAKKYKRTPTGEDARAFIEVSDSTYAEDKRKKIPIYVKAGVPTWHVHIRKRRVEFYDVGANTKTPTQIFQVGDVFDVLGVRIRVADLFDDEDAS
jgi:ribosomal protein L21